MKFNLNKIAIYFLKNVLLIFGIVLIGILVFPFPLIIVKLFNSDLVIRTYLLIGIFSIYLIAVPFIYSLFLSFKILTEIEKTNFFSLTVIDHLKNIKWSSLIISLIFLIDLPFVYLIADFDDAPGLILFNAFFIGMALVSFFFAEVLKNIVSNQIEKNII